MADGVGAGELWARIIGDERVNRVVVVKVSRDDVLVTMSVRKPCSPVPEAFRFRGNVDVAVVAAGAFLAGLPV